ncbi:MAG: type II secretion system F family protein [Candidatus Aenigmatarchaeota archaeon]
MNERLVTPRYIEYINRNLTSAGFNRIKNAKIFICIQEYLFLLSFIGLSIFFNARFALVFSIILLFLPIFLLKRNVQKRQSMILLDLPFHIDLLTICIDAGIDFAAALEKIIKNGKPGPLMDEFNITLRKIKMGTSRGDALMEMAERINLNELSSIISAIVHADKMGTGMSNVLRIQANNLRIKRFQKAEKLAAEAPVKMLLPLLLFIFPSVFIILLSPIILRILHSL